MAFPLMSTRVSVLPPRRCTSSTQTPTSPPRIPHRCRVTLRRPSATAIAFDTAVKEVGRSTMSHSVMAATWNPSVGSCAANSGTAASDEAAATAS